MSNPEVASALFASGAVDDPYPLYKTLREAAPVHSLGDGMRVVTRYGDVLACIRNHEVFSSAMMPTDASGGARIIIFTDPPDHTNLRRLVTKAFRPGAIAALEPRIRAVAHELIDDLLTANRRGEADLMNQLAIPLPVIAIADLLGIPTERREDFRRWSDDSLTGMAGMAAMDDAGVAAAGVGRRDAASMGEMGEFFAEMIKVRQSEPGDDLISALVTGAEPLSEMELLLFCATLLVAGNETTRNLIGNAMLALFENPGEAERLWSEPELVPSAMEEALRYDPPAQMVMRRATSDTSVAGEPVPEGTMAFLLLAAANRDPDQFEDPDRFDVARNPRDHVAFGNGIHLCLGAALARLEAKVAFEALIERLREIRPNGPLERNANNMLRGLQRLPITCREAA